MALARPDDRDLATFVLIPGAGTDPRVCRATIEALSDPEHDAVAPLK
jgi:hypothetical protein